MKTKFIGVLCLLSVLISVKSFAQLTISSGGAVGIKDATPDATLDVYASSVFYEYGSNHPLRFRMYASDPRITSDNKVVFYNLSNNGYIDIQCKNVYEYSDSTDKENIKDIVSSLEKIKNIDGYNFNWKNEKDKKKHAGLMAQQVQNVMPELVTKEDSTGKLMVSYTGMVAYLVEAIKEQNQHIETLENFVALQENDIVKLKNGNLEEEILTKSGNISSILYQNTPNPFDKQTNIRMYIPGVASNAFLNIYNLQGNQIQSNIVTERGEIEIKIDAFQLNPGIYLYTLIVDGKEVNTKRMILTE